MCATVGFVFSKPIPMSCPCPWMSVFSFHSQFKYLLSSSCHPEFTPQVFLLNFFAAFDMAELTLSGTSASGCQPLLVLLVS